MAIARVDNQGNYSGADASGNLNATITTSGSNTLLVVFAAIDSAGDISPTATHNSVSMGTGTEDNTTGQYQVVFTLKNPNAGTNLAVVVSTGLAGFSGGLIPVSYSGVDQTTPIGTIDAVGTAAATSLSSGTITCASGNWIVGGLSLNTQNVGLAVAVGSGNTLVSSFNDGAEGNAYAEDQDGADDTIDWSWTTSTRGSALTFEIKAAAAAGGGSGWGAPFIAGKLNHLVRVC